MAVKTNNNFSYKNLVLDIMYLVEEINKLAHVVTASQNGLQLLKDLPNLISEVNKLSGVMPKTDPQSLTLYKSAIIAKREVETEFLFLNTQFSLMLYAYLEASLKRLIKSFIRINDCSDIKEFSDIQIKLLEYTKLDEDDRHEYLYKAYEQKVTGGMNYGLNRFEKLLSPLGLAGEFPKNIGRDILELGQVRNLIIHRSGIVDRQFLKTCSWLKIKSGEKLIISKDDTQRYFNSILEYSTILSIRVGLKENPDLANITSGQPP